MFRNYFEEQSIVEMVWVFIRITGAIYTRKKVALFNQVEGFGLPRFYSHNVLFRKITNHALIQTKIIQR